MSATWWFIVTKCASASLLLYCSCYHVYLRCIFFFHLDESKLWISVSRKILRENAGESYSRVVPVEATQPAISEWAIPSTESLIVSGLTSLFWKNNRRSIVPLRYLEALLPIQRCDTDGSSTYCSSVVVQNSMSGPEEVARYINDSIRLKSLLFASSSLKSLLLLTRSHHWIAILHPKNTRTDHGKLRVWEHHLRFLTVNLHG
jgi:hypothetical protein